MAAADVPHSLAKLPETMDRWRTDKKKRHVCVLFDQLYDLWVETGHLDMGEKLETKVLNWFQTSDASILSSVRQQRIISVHSLWTHDAALFSPLRARRPGATGGGRLDSQIVDQLVSETENNCDFCDWQTLTATEPGFGRLESEHCVTAANLFKFAARHSMVLFKQHHPLNWDREQLVDMFLLAEKWFARAGAECVARGGPATACFPLVLWDSLARSGGTQLHPHCHVSLNTRRCDGGLEAWRQAALRYRAEHPGRCYMDDVVSVHQHLGLAVTSGQATALAHLTPKKDHEVLVTAAHPCEDFYSLIYYTMRAFIDDLGEASISMAVLLPPLLPAARGNPGLGGALGALARIMPRGRLERQRSDVSSQELFTCTALTVDPYAVVAMVRRSLQERQ